MPKIVENDKGEEETLYTPEELAAAKAEADAAKQKEIDELKAKAEADAAHYKTKMDEFVQGKKGIDEKEKEWNEKLENTAKTAEETKAELAAERKARLDVVKNFTFESYVGEDAESKKKLQEEYDLLNMPATTEEEIRARATKAARNAGMAGSGNPVIPSYSGGHAPAFKRDETLKDADHNAFLKEIGY